jgi:peptidoglycan/LPS O-acetylase OafA/YrhL
MTTTVEPGPLEPVMTEPPTGTGAIPNPGEHRVGLPHVAALDGLRGLAVAAVLLDHAGHLLGGYLGVDLFFVLSGYLITALLLDGWRRGGHIGLRTFWARRARRLAPALLVTLVGVGFYAAWIASPSERLNIRWDGFATLFEMANWRAIAASNDYFSHFLRSSPLGHTWSLAIEEQVYLVWPLVVAALLAWRRRPSVVLVASVIGAVASVGTMILLHAHGASIDRLYYGTDTRSSAVFLGAAVASGRVVLGPSRWAATRSVRHGLGLVAAAGLAVAWLRLDGAGAFPYEGGLALVSAGGALVVAAVADRRHPGPLGQAVSLRPLRALGLISYGLYLYHFPIYHVLDVHPLGLSGWPLIALKVAISLAAATASYHYLEQPIRKGWGRGHRQARAALLAGVALAAIALFAGTLGAVGPPSLADFKDSVAVGSDPNAPLVMMAGDSVPLLLGAEMSKELDGLHIRLANRGQPGCHLLASVGAIRGVEGNVRTDVADCAKDGQYAARVRAVHPAVAVVLFGEFPSEAVRLNGHWAMPCEPDYLKALRQHLDSLVSDLRTDHTPVVLVTAPGSSISWVLNGMKPGLAGRVACTNQVLKDIAAARKGVAVVDLASYVCPPGKECLQEIDGKNLRPDGLHFTGPGGQLIASWLIPQVLASAEPG